MKPKTFQALIDLIELQTFTYTQHNKKLRDYIMQIFFIDDPPVDPPNPTNVTTYTTVETKGNYPAAPPDEFETIETKFKKAIQKIDKQNQEYAKLLQIISDWLK